MAMVLRYLTAERWRLSLCSSRCVAGVVQYRLQQMLSSTKREQPHVGHPVEVREGGLVCLPKTAPSRMKALHRWDDVHRPLAFWRKKEKRVRWAAGFEVYISLRHL